MILSPNSCCHKIIENNNTTEKILMKKFLLTASMLGLTTVSAHAQPSPQIYVDAALRNQVNNFIANDLVTTGVNYQNERYKNLSQADVEALDQVWRQERTQEAQPFIAAILSNPVSAYLTRIQAHSGGIFTEIFIMDDKGLNVGQSSISSDYWQGDEAKWQRTYQDNVGAVFIDEPEYNSDTEQWRVQYNVAIPNESRTENIGAATFEINLSELARRAAQ